MLDMLRTFTICILAASTVMAATVDFDPDFSGVAFNETTQELELPEGAKPHSFSVPVLENPNFKRDGYHELKKAYLKYKRHYPRLVLPPGLKNYTKKSKLEARQRKFTSVDAKPVAYDTMYLSPVTIGSQSMNMDFDTGSSDFWVFSNLLPQSAQASHKEAGGKIYQISGANILSGHTWKITYADDSGASGTVVTDKVTIGEITVDKQSVEVATSVSDGFLDFEGDGLLGLGFSSLNQVSPTKQKTWFENALSQLRQRVFTADLQRGTTGSYTFGYVARKYLRQLSYVRIRSTGWWHFTANTGIKVNGQVLKDGKDNSNGAVADTGSTLLLMPHSITQLYYSKVPGAEYRKDMGAWVYPCNDNMPSLGVPIGKFYANIAGKYMTYAPANSAGTVCFGGLQSLDSSDTLPYIYGDIFFKGNFAVFDYARKRFGFASK